MTIWKRSPMMWATEGIKGLPPNPILLMFLLKGARPEKYSRQQ